MSLESRRAAEIEVLIRKQGGEPFVAPSVRERALADNAGAFELLEKLGRGHFQLLILTTGVGLSFWKDLVAASFPPERIVQALQAVTLLVRGPKPTAVLRTLGLAPQVTVPEPNTWHEVIEAVAKRPERRIAIQEYGRPNQEFVTALESLGARVETFALYRWELPEDTQPLRAAVGRLAARQADVILFTSSVQVEHLLQIADEEGLREQLLSALRVHVAVASVGPIMSEALVAQGIPPDIEPQSPKMGPLVYAASEGVAAVISKKRNG